jgi:hypothetical protein
VWFELERKKKTVERHITQLGKNLKQAERIGRNRTTAWHAH